MSATLPGRAITHHKHSAHLGTEARSGSTEVVGPGGPSSQNEEDTMELSTETWTVELLLSERDGHTHAEARLHSRRPTALTASGDARLSSEDPVDVPEIGYELAAARALVHLGELLVSEADGDVHALLRDLHRT